MARKMITLRLAPELTESLKEEAANSSITLTEHVTRLIHKGRENSFPDWPDITEQINKLEKQCQQTQESTLHVKNKLEKVADNLKSFEIATDINIKQLQDSDLESEQQVRLTNNRTHHLEGQIKTLLSILNNIFNTQTDQNTEAKHSTLSIPSPMR